MRFNKFLILLTAFTSLFLTACGGGVTETPKNTANANVAFPVNVKFEQLRLRQIQTARLRRRPRLRLRRQITPKQSNLS